MRKLTIKRKKKFVACLGKMKVYIEDAQSSELIISGVPCRKLGALKNGEEKTFEISENAAKIFVIADNLSKDYCTEFYQLTDGQDDIVLTGENYFNPANGNAFRFDNNNSEEVLAARKKGNQKGTIVLIIAIIVGFIIGFAISSGILFK